MTITFYLNFRTQSVGGGVAGPRAWQGEGDADQPALLLLEDAAVRGLVAGRDVLFAVHGFATDQLYGTRMFARLNERLALPASSVFIGVLWPGDSWLPFVDYPIEGSVSMDTGNRLAGYCNTWLGAANSFSFVSHSLGARVVLQTLAGLNRKAKLACLTAAAVNQSCLAEEYAAARRNVETMTLLTSRKDQVLELAYPPGDLVADTFVHDHPYLEPALGYDGPSVGENPLVAWPWRICDVEAYNHGDYHAPGDNTPPPVDGGGQPKWLAVAAYFLRALNRQPQIWPTC
jgi:Alpha/beta hydrolase of unknown function (DUF900)